MPRLIRVEDGVQVWSHSFEEPVDYIFEVEEKLSQDVMRQMGIVLRPEQTQAIERPPTANRDAYQAYIRGLGLKNQPFYSEDHLLQAIPLFERAVKLDPAFAAAWAQLSQTHSYLAFNTDPSPNRIELAKHAVAMAKEIDPDGLEVRLAQAYYTYRCLGSYASAEQQLREILGKFPNNVDALVTMGLVMRRTGKLSQAIETFKNALDLNPQEVRLHWWIGETYRAMRKYAEANASLDQAVSMAPDQEVYWLEKAENFLAWTGDPKKVWKLIADSPEPTGPTLAILALQLDLYQRNYKSALSRFTPETMKELEPQVRGRIAVLSVVAQERLGDHNGALAAAEENRQMLTQRVDRFPTDVLCRAYLAVALAQLGRGEEAMAQASQAVQMAKVNLLADPEF
jgi:tetratricopeptide (TPR) repeat protein